MMAKCFIKCNKCGAIKRVNPVTFLQRVIKYGNEGVYRRKYEIFLMAILIMIILSIILVLALPPIWEHISLNFNPCTDDCCPPNHCPYNNGCVTKQDLNYCINPENNLSYMEEIERGIKIRDWDVRQDET